MYLRVKTIPNRKTECFWRESEYWMVTTINNEEADFWLRQTNLNKLKNEK